MKLINLVYYIQHRSFSDKLALFKIKNKLVSYKTDDIKTDLDFYVSNKLT